MTPQQISYLHAHINDRPRTDVAKAAGVCLKTLYRFVREHGGELLYERSKRNKKWERIVRQHYHHMSGHEIERRFGITHGRANKIARSLGLKHSPELEQRIREDGNRNLRNTRTPESYMQAAKKRKARRRIDELRAWEGKEQLTKLRLKTMPHKSYQAKWHLIRHFNYFAVDGEPYILGYDEDTRRNAREQHYTEKYGLRFLQADEEQDKHLHLTNGQNTAWHTEIAERWHTGMECLSSTSTTCALTRKKR